MTRSHLWPRLQSSIIEQQNAGRTVWIVAHFPDQFLAVQHWLAVWNLDYLIVSRPLDSRTATVISKQEPAQIQLAIGELLSPPETMDVEFDSQFPLSIIVIERHPLIHRDLQLQAFARNMPCRVRFGYFLSIDDVVLRRVVSETMIQLLKQLGMRDHELITSNMITRRLEKFLRRDVRSGDERIRADSAAQWYEQREA